MALSSCTLIGSIQRDCRDSNGGIIEIKVKVLPSLATLTADYSVSSGVVSIASPSRSTWYTYYFEKQTASFTETLTGNPQQGTNAYAQEMKVIFNKLSAQIRNEIQVLSKNPIQIAIRDRNDVYWLAGYEFGMDLTTAISATGVAMGDRNGYDLTFAGAERVPMLNLTAAGYSQLITV